MKNYFPVLFLFFVSSLFAQQNSLLWEISGKGINKPSYLYGTMHLRDSRLFCFPDSAQQKLDSCAVLALEVVIDFKDTKALMNAILVQDENNYLSKILSKQDYKKVRKAVKENCDLATFVMMDKVRPLMLAASIMEGQMKNDVKYPMDIQFQLDAQKQGKSLYSLESAASQIAVLDKIPLDIQKRELLSAVDSMQQNKVLLDSMIQMYLRQDLAGLQQTSEGSTVEFDSLWQSELLDKRNAIMVNGIHTLLPKGNAFIAFGAAHLGGENGLIELLRKEGYVVRPVFSTCSQLRARDKF
ncbi:MAG: TraB/GumN family protein [Flavobacteriales bacterium]